MVDMHSKHDNMHKNGMFYASICIINFIITCKYCVLSIEKNYEHFHEKSNYQMSINMGKTTTTQGAHLSEHYT